MANDIHYASRDLDEDAVLLPGDEIPRRDTGLRIGLTLLFLLIAGVIESVLIVILIFELVATLVTQRPPAPRIRDLANRIISYYYRLGRYMTYNESRVPFPFSDFPRAVEPDAWRPEDSESKALGLADFEADEDEDYDEDEREDR